MGQAKGQGHLYGSLSRLPPEWVRLSQESRKAGISVPPCTDPKVKPQVPASPKDGAESTCDSQRGYTTPGAQRSLTKDTEDDATETGGECHPRVALAGQREI